MGKNSNEAVQKKDALKLKLESRLRNYSKSLGCYTILPFYKVLLMAEFRFNQIGLNDC